MEHDSFYEFGPFRLDAKERVLLRNGRLVPLAPKALSTLLVLVRNKGHVVAKDLLMKEVWPDEIVEEGNLTQHVFMARRALGETTGTPGYIETIPRRGYRFLEPQSRAATAHLNRLPQERGETGTASEAHLLAVLPFHSDRGDQTLEDLSDGVTESLINNLSALPQLRVAARSTVFLHKGDPDHQNIGRELGVQFVLVGHIKTRGEELIIAAELVDVVNGWQMWGRIFSMSVGLLDIQDEIAREIALSLRLRLMVGQEHRLTRHHTESFEAYQAYLKGRFYWSKLSEAGLHKSKSCFADAIRLDPKYALAHSGLADSYNALGFYCIVSPQEAFAKAKEAALKALTISRNLAEPYASLGFAQLQQDWDWHNAEQNFKRSIELNPNYLMARIYYGSQLIAMGRFAEAIAQYNYALHIDPLSLIANAALGYGYYFARRYDQAIAQCTVATELDEHFEVAHVFCGWAYQQKAMSDAAILAYESAMTRSGRSAGIVAALGTAYALCGNKEQARKILGDLENLATQKHVSSYDAACIHAALGDNDEAFKCLEKAYEHRSHSLVNLQVDPKFDSLRSDPRFANLVERVFSKSDTENDAYRAFLKGRRYWSQHTNEGLRLAIEHFRRAIKLDPGYVLAYTALVDCYLRLTTNYFLPASAPESAKHSSQITTIEDLPPQPPAALKLRDQWDLATTEREMKRARELESKYPTADQWHASYLFAQKLYEEKLARSNEDLTRTLTAHKDGGSDEGSASKTKLTRAEAMQVFCLVAREQIEAGNVEAACLMLRNWYELGEWPRLEGLGPESSADLLLTSGLIAGRLGSYRQVPRGQIHAEALINGALGLFEQLGLKSRAAECKSELGRCYDREGKFDLARTNFLGALEDFPETEYEARAKSLIRLAFAEMKTGHLHESLMRLKEATEIVASAGPATSTFFHIEMATTLGELAIAEGSQEYFNRACEHYEAGLSKSEAVGHHRRTAVLESNHGYLLLAFDRLEEAEPRLVRGRGLFDHFLDRSPQLDETLARLYLQTEQFELAEQAIIRSIVALEKGGEAALLAESLRTQGRILCKLKRQREARKAFDRAYQIADLCGDQEGAGLALLLMIEELPDDLPGDELPEVFRSAEGLLGQSQRSSNIERLSRCRERLQQNQPTQGGE
ncbi:MAG TPA: winged helix-turn-helix domain-containing protein [Pyrinomonadaceae bacterium]|jgi:DNA-binding winged helix-turn-helix (wHTH) protein/tetratricopeptide (TPR) repeat protein|nr:winged helix-turn-helix domain-containing protein [Pyrinomonadaceae bacterium]